MVSKVNALYSQLYDALYTDLLDKLCQIDTFDTQNDFKTSPTTPYNKNRSHPIRNTITSGRGSLFPGEQKFDENPPTKETENIAVDIAESSQNYLESPNKHANVMNTSYSLKKPVHNHKKV